MFNSDCREDGRTVCCCKSDKSYCHAWTTATTTTLLSHSPTSSPSPISSLITKTSATSSSSKTLISTSITEMSSPTSSSMTRVPTLMAQTSTTATLSPSPISTMTAESTTASSPLPVQSLITEIEKTSPSSTSPIPTFMRDSSTAAAFPSAVPSTKSPALQSTITQLSSKTTQIPTWKILEGINASRIFLEDAKKLPPGGNDRNILVATHELESFAIKYGKIHLTAKESAVIVQELFGEFCALFDESVLFYFFFLFYSVVKWCVWP
ncbi:unnamed protein product [Porites lobata]|uniref:Uncharacterized protein n=1 Tax=Porites lobata TaxID=104759 RepID=A0ABN8RYG0_9CNID|nr:unnamed protein product [Porites lobata]